MPETLFLVDQARKKTTPVQPVSLASIGVSERKDLQQWVLDNPSILGEQLLIVTSEFDRFDKSSKRLDLLALDVDGVLTVVELKLDTGDAAGTHADLRQGRPAIANVLDAHPSGP